MNGIDLVVWIIVVLAVWNGWRQGMIRQLLSLAGLAAGIWLGVRYGAWAGGLLGLAAPYAAPGGFAAVLLATVLAVALVARLLRSVSRLAGLGVLDVVLGILFALAKTVLVLSLLAALLGFFNADYRLVSREKLAASHWYGPLTELSEHLLPYLEWVGQEVPRQLQSEGDGA